MTALQPDRVRSGEPGAAAGVGTSGDGVTPQVAGHGRRSTGSPELAVMGALGLVSVLNYAYTAILIYLLPARQYALVGAASALLLVCGTVAGAAVPWVLAREIAHARRDPARRQAAVSFCLVGTLAEAVASGLVTGTISAAYGSSTLDAAVVGSVVAIFTSATACGYLQGFERFGMIAALKASEVVIKLVTGVVLVEAGFGAAGAVAGFAVGSAVVTVVGVGFMRPDLRLVRSALTDRRLWSAATGLMSIQGGVALLASLDVIIGSLVITDRANLATYEVAQILTRVPVFVATAMSIIVFPRLVTRDRRAQTVAIGDNLRLWLRICIPVAMVTATVPGGLLQRLVPHGYGAVDAVVVWTTLAGLLTGLVNLASTYFQAADLYRVPCWILAVGVVSLAGGAWLGVSLDGIRGLALSVVVVAGGVGAAFVVHGSRRWPGMTHGLGRAVVGPAVVCLPLVVVRGHLWAWLVWVLLGAVGSVMAALVRFGRTTAAGRPRVLHLAFEDPERPGAGGGSVRTREVNRRLAERFDVTVVCARYRGCRRRTEHGVRYVHVGMALGYFPGLLAYFAALPWALARYDSDLVVEDFAAPFSTVAVPWLTRRPVIGVVQWLFAADKAAQYHLPFHLVERLGIRSHRRLVAVSEDLGRDLRTRNAQAEVCVIPNGLPEEAFGSRGDHRRRDVVYLGRLEVAQKGLDLLLEAWRVVAGRTDASLVIAGDGPDGARLRRTVDIMGLGPRVRFVGRVAAEDRWELLAAASVVVMPSRYETFGMVAAEALAVATPVVAFDIACLGNLVDHRTGVVVAPFDSAVLGEAIADLLADPARARRLGRAGPDRVAPLRWDHVAHRQGDLYDEVLRTGRLPATDDDAVTPTGAAV